MESNIHITHSTTEADMANLLLAETGNRFLAGNRIMGYLRSLMGGIRSAKLRVAVNVASATGTITLSSHVATDTVTINGTTFTCVASGATGNQYNVGGSDTLTAAALAAAINASASMTDYVTATSAGAIVTITASRAGKLGNAITIAISAHGTASGARLTGGDNGAQTKSFYYGATDPTT